MGITIGLILMLLALVLVTLAAFRVSCPIDLGWAGVACALLSLIVGT